MVDVTEKPVAAEKDQGSEKKSESESHENKVAGKPVASKHTGSERLDSLKKSLWKKHNLPLRQ